MVPSGDVNQLTINAGYRESTRNTVFSFNCSACAEPHSPHHKIHFKKGGHQPAIKLMPPKAPSLTPDMDMLWRGCHLSVWSA
ncbi:hypothetical protein CRH02_14405 [Escherichia albertii]|nr:hypothetical protein CRH02_14405 [Escherichia albertii]